MPAVTLPTEFKNKLPAAEANEPPAKSKLQQDSDLTEWWRSFGNRELEQLVDRGLANNPDLRMAMLRVAQAKERVDQAQAGKLPTVTAPMLSGLQAPGGLVGTTPNSGGISQIQRNYQASLSATWHLDVWGEVSSQIESAKFQLWRAVFERDDTQRSMVANLTATYLQYVALNDRLRVARQNESVLNEIQTSLEKRVNAGDATLSDSAQQKAGIFALQAAIPSMEQQREDLLNTIAFLVGAVPGTLVLSDDGLDSITPPAVVPGLPSALLLRRPDVRMAEARLLSADADIDVARARILPAVDLSAQGGLSTIIFSQILSPQSLFWNAIANLSVSVFDSGKKQSDKKLSKEVHEEMIEGYAKTINQAMREVEGALSTIRQTEKRMDSARQAADASRQAWEINTRVFAMGAVEYQTFLDTERSYHRYLDDYQQIRMEHARAYISLFSALGGGVRPAEATPGKGARPAVAAGGTTADRQTSPAPTAAISKPSAIDGIDRSWGGSGDTNVENFWQVELPGLYSRSTIGAAWRDLRNRYPSDTKSLFLRPRLNGKIEESGDGQESWYRLYVAKFSSPQAAEEFCVVLKSGYQRCRIVSSRSDETVTVDDIARNASAANQKPDTDSARNTVNVVPDQSSTQAARESTAEAVAEPLALKLEPELTVMALPSTRVVVSEPPAAGTGSAGRPQKFAYALQFGVFASPEHAGAMQASLLARGYPATIADNSDAAGQRMYAVRSGSYPDRSSANRMASAVRHKEKVSVMVVPAMVDASGELPLTSSASAVKPVLESSPELKLLEDGLGAKSDGAREKSGAELAYAVQLGAFPVMEKASAAQVSLNAKGYKTYINTIHDAGGRTWYAVRTGLFLQRHQASSLARAIARKRGTPAIVVQMDEIVGENKLEQQQHDPLQKTHYAIQLGAFSSLQSAAKSYAAWREKGHDVYVCELRDAKGDAKFAVRQGEFARRADADSLVKSVGRNGQTKAILVVAQTDGEGRLEKVDVSSWL